MTIAGDLKQDDRWYWKGIIRMALVAFAGVVCVAAADYSDKDQIRSLQSSLSESQPATERVRIMNELAQSYLFDSIEMSLRYAQEALVLAERIEDGPGISTALNQLAMACEIKGALPQALDLYQRAFDRDQRRRDFQEASQVLVNMAEACQFANDKAQSVIIYERALAHAQQNGLWDQLSSICNDLGAVFQEMGEYKKAKKIYALALSIPQLSVDNRARARSLENLGFLHSLGPAKDTACLMLVEAVQIYASLNMDIEVFQAKLSLGQVHVERGRIDEAEMVITGMIDCEPGHIPPAYLAKAQLILATIRTHQAKYDEAIALLDDGFDMVRNVDIGGLKADYMQQYAKVYGHLHQYRSALDYTNQRLSLIDTLNRMDRLDLEREMRAEFHVREQEAALEASHQQEVQERREKQWMLVLLIISFVLILLISVFAVSKTRLNRMLIDKNHLIDRSLQEKKLLIREIQHRVRNNLQIISSLLSLQVRSSKGEESRMALLKGQRRVDAIALVYKNIYRSDKITGVEVTEYIEMLSQMLRRAHPQINIETEVDPVILDVDVLVPIGLIINELMNNTIQYSLGNETGGRIKISLKEVEDFMELLLEDNGRGLSLEELQAINESGFKLINAYLQKLHGSIRIGSNFICCQFDPYIDQAA